MSKKTEVETIPKAKESGSCRYHIEIDVNSNSSHATMLRLIGNGKRVLELGCSVGDMSRILRDRDCQVVAIEIDAQAAERASVFCENVIVGDLDHLDLERELGPQKFDVVVAGDVLEHLKDPLTVLKAMKSLLRPEGYVVVSIPNVAHFSVRLALLGGKFPYGETGLLDRTHLRFFTRDSVETLFEDAGFAIGHLQRIDDGVPAEPARYEVPYNPGVIPREAFEALSRDPEAWTYQFVVVGYPLPHSGLSFLQERLRQLAGEAEDARRRAGDLERQVQSLAERAAAAESENIELLAHDQQQIQDLTAALQTSEQQAAGLRQKLEEQEQQLAGMTARLEAYSTRERDLRDMLMEAHDQLLRRDEEVASMLVPALRQASAAPPQSAPLKPLPIPGEIASYQQLVRRIRELVRSALPNGGNVAVISKGDDQLLKLEPCRGLHFPQTADGTYAGHYPADGPTALALLKELQQRGAQYLLIPQTALWWLDHYTEFATYLYEHLQVIHEPGLCVMFDLVKKGIPAHSRALRTSIPGQPKPFGMNVSGHLGSEKGIGEGARSTVRSLQAAGVPYILDDFIDVTSDNRDTILGSVNPVQGNPYSVNLIHLNADSAPEFIRARGGDYVRGRYNIGYWVWELSSFPACWGSSFKHFGEIWVPTTFVLDAISRVSPIPVLTIPHSLPESLPIKKCDRQCFGLPRDKFLFLFMFDFMSIAERKNPLGVIGALKRAFRPSDKAMLVLKVAHSENAPATWKALKQAASQANIRLIDGVLSKLEINALLNICDCYVSLHRSEGFGLTMAEAMCLQKPVIATGYSGNTDFMTATNSFLVKYKLVNLKRDYGPYQKGCIWADPDMDHAAELMRFVYENRKTARAVGRQARRDILQRFGAPAVGAMIRDRLKKLAEMGRLLASTEGSQVESRIGQW
jgi:2-polyprenyl-3-methyl-5-hydroxy-6-metoxy-1,4-benzoquinol methylase/glycosyltransferase involved in cell wall biosynthesis